MNALPFVLEFLETENGWQVRVDDLPVGDNASNSFILPEIFTPIEANSIIGERIIREYIM